METGLKRMSDWLVVSLLCVQTLTFCGCDEPARTEGDIGTNTPTVSGKTMPGMGGVDVMQQQPVDDVPSQVEGDQTEMPIGGRALDMSGLAGGQPVLEMPTRPSQTTGRPEIKVEGNTLVVDGVPFHIKGVNWNPVAKGKFHPQDLDFAGYVEQDSALMAQAGINAVRTFEPIITPWY